MSWLGRPLVSSRKSRNRVSRKKSAKSRQLSAPRIVAVSVHLAEHCVAQFNALETREHFLRRHSFKLLGANPEQLRRRAERNLDAHARRLRSGEGRRKRVEVAGQENPVNTQAACWMMPIHANAAQKPAIQLTLTAWDSRSGNPIS